MSKSIRARATSRTGYHSGFGPWGGRANYGGVGNPLATRTGRHRTAPTFMFGGDKGKPMKRLKTTKGLTRWHLEKGVVKTKVKCYDKCKHFALHYQHPDAETAGGVDTMANKVPFNRANVNEWATKTKTSECDSTPTAAELALDKIIAYAADTGNPIIATTPTKADYDAAGFYGVSDTNLSNVNTRIGGESSLNTKNKIQLAINIQIAVMAQTAATNAANALETLTTYAADTENPITATTPTKADYDTAGVIGMRADVAGVSMVTQINSNINTDGASTLATIQAIVDLYLSQH